MGNKCMPGMTMPGCIHGSAGSPIGHGIDAGSSMLSAWAQAALLVVLTLALVGLAIAVWRLLRRRDIPRYDWVAEWPGHGAAHAVGMILMSILMLGWVRSIGPTWLYVVAYGSLAVVFAIRAVIARDGPARREDLWHMFVHLSMVYMFAILQTGAVLLATVACLVVYLLLIADHLWRALRRSPPGEYYLTHDHREHGSGIVGHFAISCR